jgi:hypothetical protein
VKSSGSSRTNVFSNEFGSTFLAITGLILFIMIIGYIVLPMMKLLGCRKAKRKITDDDIKNFRNCIFKKLKLL